MRDSWDLDHSLAKWILPRLEYLRCNSNGFNPSVVYDHELLKEAYNDGYVESGDVEKDGMTLHNYVIDRMIYSFMFVLNGYDSKEYCDVCRYQSGMNIFAKYFYTLWD